MQKLHIPQPAMNPDLNGSRPTTEGQAILEVLCQIRDAIGRLTDELRENRTRRRDTPDGDAVLRVLLPAVAGRLGSGCFTSRQVVEDSVFMVLLGPGMSTGRLGCLLGAACGRNIGGYVVQRSGRDHNARYWSVVQRVGGIDPTLP